MITDSFMVNTASHRYPLVFGEGILAHAGEVLAPHLPSQRVVIITDRNVHTLYGEMVQHSLQMHGYAVQCCVVEAGEASKSFTIYAQLCEDILATQPDRRTTLLALGGGVVGDLTGFIAATLLRGLPFIQIPTTLLAQVDSSVGGKVAINSAAGKNLVGAFYQPRAVFMDMQTLQHLPEKELLSGYGEIIKYGLLGDAAFYEGLLHYGGVHALLRDGAMLQSTIQHCCAMKAAIVAEDETEQGKRALLNLGHTFAHAIEKATGYTASHGQAVALGCLMAMRLSQLLGYAITDAEIATLQAHYHTIGMPTRIGDCWAMGEQSFPRKQESIIGHDNNHGIDSRFRGSDETLFIAGENVTPATLTHYCYGDKKASDGALTFVALERIGSAVVAKGVNPALATQVFTEFL